MLIFIECRSIIKFNEELVWVIVFAVPRVRLREGGMLLISINFEFFSVTDLRAMVILNEIKHMTSSD